MDDDDNGLFECGPKKLVQFVNGTASPLLKKKNKQKKT